MHKIDGAGHVNGQFVNEDAATNRPPTEITPDWLSAVQNELITVIESSGIALDKANNAQLLAALKGGGLFDTQATGDSSRKVATTAFVHQLLAALPGDKFLQGLSSYNATTNVMKLAMSDGSTVDVDMTALVNDAMPNLSDYATYSYVNQMGISISGFKTYLQNAQMIESDAGKLVLVGSGITITLPIAENTSKTSLITISNLDISPVTIMKGVSSGIYAYGLQSAASVPLNPGASIQLATDGNNWMMVAGSDGGLGINQLPHNVTASRPSNTVFKNPSYTKPLAFCVSGNVTASGHGIAEVTINNNVVYRGHQSSQTVGISWPIGAGMFIVPPRCDYSCIYLFDSNTLWSELYL